MKLFSFLFLKVLPINFLTKQFFFTNLNQTNNIIIKNLLDDPILQYYNTSFRFQFRVKKFDRYCQKFIINHQFPKDFFGLRIIYHSPQFSQDEFISYLILNNVERNNKVVKKSYKDYIFNKKDNDYQSLHINIFTNYFLIFYFIEIQIRSEEMDYYNNFGPPSDYYLNR